jgi:7,8-dihydropterin-6-yl-methyl-4-(beta-D-ribofuranosyl)aminobenzene 5'-phosphate synthase
VVIASLLGACRSTAPSDPVTASTASTVPAPTTTAAEPVARQALATGARVKALSITVLSTTHAPVGTGEWGFSALVEADGHRILFDTGAKPETVLRNAEALGIDLATIPTVVLSHHHDDHVGGLMTLRRAVAERAPTALATVHVGAGIFAPRRRGTKPAELNAMIAMRPAFEATGGVFVEHAAPGELVPGVWVTGPVPRVHPERNWSGARLIEGPGGWVEDTLPEGQELVIDTDEGLVVLSGCGHAGVVNIVTHARATIRAAPLRAAVGGFHLMDAAPAHLEWTGARLREVGLGELLAAHCTGDAAVRHFGAHVVPAGGRAAALGVGDRFTLPTP